MLIRPSRRSLLTGAAALAAMAALPALPADANRLLRHDFKGAWSPWAIPRSISAEWWSAMDHGTPLMTDDGSGLISNWKSRVTGLAVTAATTARATWTSTAFNSAYPGLTFDGTANCFVTTTMTTLPTGATAGEIWGVCFPTTNALSGEICRYGGPSTDTRILRKGSANSGQVSDGTVNITSGVTMLLPVVVLGQWSGTTETGFQNGTAFGGNPGTISTLNTGTTRCRIGASSGVSAGNFFPGVISELLVIKGDSSAITLPGRLTTLRQDLEGYFSWVYGFQTLLPASHPFRYVAP